MRKLKLPATRESTDDNGSVGLNFSIKIKQKWIWAAYKAPPEEEKGVLIEHFNSAIEDIGTWLFKWCDNKDEFRNVLMGLESEQFE